MPLASSTDTRRSLRIASLTTPKSPFGRVVWKSVSGATSAVFVAGAMIAGVALGVTAPAVSPVSSPAATTAITMGGATSATGPASTAVGSATTTGAATSSAPAAAAAGTSTTATDAPAMASFEPSHAHHDTSRQQGSGRG